MKALVIAIIFQCFLWVFSVAAPNAQVYLMKYGYIDAPNTKTGQIRPRHDLVQALKQFQRFANIAVTGISDDATKKKMQQPRCGLPDVIGSSDNARRKRRYALQGSRWSKSALTYSFENFGDDLTSLDVRRSFQAAKRLWSNAAKLTLTEVPSNPDFVVKFAKGDHGDGDPFDGPGGTLAHAFFPQYGGHLHFDDSETYTIDNRKAGATDLLQIAVHELGHSLGLSHSDVPESIMAPYYTGYNQNVKLHQDDINGIQHLYGKRDDSPDSVVPTMPSVAKGAPDKCKTTLDAGMLASDGHVYMFKGSYVWKLGDRGFEPGFPQRIQNIWKELPSDLDAALGWKRYLFFFKGFQYWRYDGTKLSDGFPRQTSELGLPGNIDAAFVWGGNGRIFFIKGQSYYRIRDWRMVDSGYPRALSVWQGLPSEIDAAVLDPRGRTQFFSGNIYFRFDDKNFKVQSGYPQSMNKNWLGCENAYVKMATNTEIKNFTCPCTCGSAALFHLNYEGVLVFVMVTSILVLLNI